MFKHLKLLWIFLTLSGSHEHKIHTDKVLRGSRRILLCLFVVVLSALLDNEPLLYVISPTLIFPIDPYPKDNHLLVVLQLPLSFLLLFSTRKKNYVPEISQESYNFTSLVVNDFLC